MFASSISGLAVTQASFDVTANDVANVSSAGFRPGRAEVSSSPSGPVLDAVSRAGQEPPGGLSGTSLAEELPQLGVLGAAYGAGAAAIRAQDETLGSLLDVLA